MEEEHEKTTSRLITEEPEQAQEIDLNSMFPGKGYDLNRLFPDEATRKLLGQVKRNKKDVERFIKNLSLEEE